VKQTLSFQGMTRVFGYVHDYVAVHGAAPFHLRAQGAPHR
jgi:hypothetical protein